MADALKDINLTIPAGTVCALLGPTNAGKTTLLRSVAGVLGSHHREALSSGTMRIGKELFAPLPTRVMFPGVGLTSQDPYFQISGLRQTVFEEIALTLEALDFPQSEIIDRVRNVLERFGLSHCSERQPSTLSGGELQRVALANILVAEPQVLLLDEPSNSLDGTAQRQLISLICSLRGNTTAIIADNQLEFGIRTADQFVVLDAGTIVFNGNRSSFFENLSHFLMLLPVESLNETLRAANASSLKRTILEILGIG